MQPAPATHRTQLAPKDTASNVCRFCDSVVASGTTATPNADWIRSHPAATQVTTIMAVPECEEFHSGITFPLYHMDTMMPATTIKQEITIPATPKDRTGGAAPPEKCTAVADVLIKNAMISASTTINEIIWTWSFKVAIGACAVVSPSRS